MNSNKQFVECDGERYYVGKDNSLMPWGCEIKTIDEIEGLENLLNLETLLLGDSGLEDLSGLKILKNLKVLVVADNNISQIEGLENLINLK